MIIKYPTAFYYIKINKLLILMLNILYFKFNCFNLVNLIQTQKDFEG